MSEQREPGAGAPAGAARAVVTSRRRPSIVWLIPVVAALAGGFVAWKTLSERGPRITIRFSSAEGLEAGKTQIRYKDVPLGIVEDVDLLPDLSGVVCEARMDRDATDLLTEKTRFWVVKARVAGGQVSGLGTLLSGSYIGVDPVREGKPARDYTALEVPPIVTADQPGRHFVLRSDRTGAVEVGAPVLFRSIQVGQVVASELDPDSDFVTTRIFVRAPHDERVRTGTRFWNASGIDVTVGADGVKVDTGSLASILIGGIAFETPEAPPTAVAAADAVFPLYENHEAALRRHYTERVQYLVEFDQSVRGLGVGAPVEFRGIQIGDVVDVRIEFSTEKSTFVIPVTIEIEPERFTSEAVDPVARRATVDRLVAAGLRAQLKTGSLLTGKQIIALDFHPEAPPAEVAWNEPIPRFPTVPTSLEEATASLTRLAERLGKVPVDQIGADLAASLAALRKTLDETEGVGPALKATLEQTDRTLASLGPDSNVNAELRRTLIELSDAARALGLAAEQIQAQPNSVIFGRKGTQ